MPTRRALRSAPKRQLTVDKGKPLPQEGKAGEHVNPHVKHIVVLMMENHSYDNYFGTHPRNGPGDGFTRDPDGHLPFNANENEKGNTVAVFHNVETTQSEGVPTQAWHPTHLQAKNHCSGFVKSVQETLPGLDPTVPMGYWDRSDLPFYYGLADVFPLCTRWHCSCLGPTFPNRRFLMAGTAHGLIDDLPFAMVDYPNAGTIFDLLDSYGVSWRNYHVCPRWKVLAKHVFGVPGVNVGRYIAMTIGNLIPSLKRYAEGRLQCTASIYPLHFARARHHLRTFDQFEKDAQDGALPAFCIVDPDFGWCSEENPQDIQAGESFASRAIDAVMHGKSWADTVLIWVYDEHGGYYDHIDPPKAEPPDDGVEGRYFMSRGSILRPFNRTKLGKKYTEADEGTLAYDQLGFRVPAVLVSPWARRDFVCSQTFEHSSILRFVEDVWNLPSLTNRDQHAVSIEECLDFSGAPPFECPPELPQPARSWDQVSGGPIGN
jgi:phospholipase C